MPDKLHIEIRLFHEGDPRPQVKATDLTMGYGSGWVRVDEALQGQSPEVIFAAAMLVDKEMQRLSRLAQQHEFELLLNDKPYNGKIPTLEAAQALVDQALLDTSTPVMNSGRSLPRRRM